VCKIQYPCMRSSWIRQQGFAVGICVRRTQNTGILFRLTQWPKLFFVPSPTHIPPPSKNVLVTESDFGLHKRFVVIGKCMAYKLSLLISECAYT
jgi:hypothetical protein